MRVERLIFAGGFADQVLVGLGGTPNYKTAMRRPSKRTGGESSGAQERPLRAGESVRDPAGTQYKIQVLGIGDQWGDLKESIEGGPYRFEVYRTKAEARAEVDAMVEETDAGPGEYRVVDVNLPEAIGFIG